MTDALNTTIIECGREQSEETLALGLDHGLNAKWSNQLKTGVFVNAGDKISVASSSINAVGNDAGTIEMEGTLTHRDNSFATASSPAITDGQATLNLNEYKSADGCFYDFLPVKRTNQDRRIAPKVAKHNGKKYTRCIWDTPPAMVIGRIPACSSTITPSTHTEFHSWGQVDDTAYAGNDTYNLTEPFKIFSRDVSVDIPKGFFAPQQIAKSITQQLQKVTNISNIKMNTNPYLNENNWIYRNVGSGQPNVSTIIESNSFKPRPAVPLSPANAENQTYRGGDEDTEIGKKVKVNDWEIATDTQNAYMYGKGDATNSDQGALERGNKNTFRGGGFNNKNNPSIENSIPAFEATFKQIGGQGDQREGYWNSDVIFDSTIRSGTEYNTLYRRSGDYNQPRGEDPALTGTRYLFDNDSYNGLQNPDYSSEGIPTDTDPIYTFMTDFYALNPEFILEGKKLHTEIKTLSSTNITGEYDWNMRGGYYYDSVYTDPPSSASEPFPDGTPAQFNIESNTVEANGNTALQTNMKWKDLIKSIEAGGNQFKDFFDCQLYSSLDQVSTLNIGGYGVDGSKQFGFSELTNPDDIPNRKFIHVESCENGGIGGRNVNPIGAHVDNQQTLTEIALGAQNERVEITWTQDKHPFDFAYNDYDPTYRGTKAQSVLYNHSLRNNDVYSTITTSREQEENQDAVYGVLYKTLDYTKSYAGVYTDDDFYVSFIIPIEENILGGGIANPNATLYNNYDPATNLPLENISVIYKGNKIGFSPVWNVLGNECMSLNNGYLNWTALSDTITDGAGGGGDTITTPQLKFGLVSGNIDRVMIGAISPKVNYDETSGKFFLSDFHTANCIHQDFMAGDTLRTTTEAEQGQSATLPLIKAYQTKNMFPAPYNKGFNNNINSDAGTPIYSFHKVNRSNNVGMNADFNPAIAHETERGFLYDSMSGLFITDFNVGIGRDFWSGTIWDKLGFTYDNTHLIEGGRNIRNINYYETTGRTQYTSGKYGVTTGAEVLGKSAFQLATGRFNQPLFSLGLNRMQSSLGFGLVPLGQFPETMEMGNPLLPADSTQFTAFNLPTKTENSFYTICSDIVQGNSTYLGGRGGGERLPVISIIQKYYSGTDFFYGTDSTMGFIATKPFMLNNITTEIRKPNGKLATNLSGRSTIIFRIDRRTPQPLPMISAGGGSGTVKPVKQKESPLQMIDKQIRELTGKTKQENIIAGEALGTLERLYQPFLTEEQRQGTERKIPNVEGREGMGSVQQRLQLARELKSRGFNLEEEPIGKQRQLIKALNIEKASKEQGRAIPFNIALGQVSRDVETRGRPKGAEQSLIDLQKYIRGVGERASYQAYGGAEQGRREDTEYSTRGEEVPPMHQGAIFTEEGETLKERRAIEALTKPQ